MKFTTFSYVMFQPTTMVGGIRCFDLMVDFERSLDALRTIQTDSSNKLSNIELAYMQITYLIM